MFVDILCNIYSGTSLVQTPWVPRLTWCHCYSIHFRGRYVLQRIHQDILIKFNTGFSTYQGFGLDRFHWSSNSIWILSIIMYIVLACFGCVTVILIVIVINLRLFLALLIESSHGLLLMRGSVRSVLKSRLNSDQPEWKRYIEWVQSMARVQFSLSVLICMWVNTYMYVQLIHTCMWVNTYMYVQLTYTCMYS